MMYTFEKKIIKPMEVSSHLIDYIDVELRKQARQHNSSLSMEDEHAAY